MPIIRIVTNRSAAIIVHKSCSHRIASTSNGRSLSLDLTALDLGHPSHGAACWAHVTREAVGASRNASASAATDALLGLGGHRLKGQSMHREGAGGMNSLNPWHMRRSPACCMGWRRLGVVQGRCQ